MGGVHAPPILPSITPAMDCSSIVWGWWCRNDSGAPFKETASKDACVSGFDSTSIEFACRPRTLSSLPGPGLNGFLRFRQPPSLHRFLRHRIAAPNDQVYFAVNYSLLPIYHLTVAGAPLPFYPHLFAIHLRGNSGPRQHQGPVDGAMAAGQMPPYVHRRLRPSSENEQTRNLGMMWSNFEWKKGL